MNRKISLLTVLGATMVLGVLGATTAVAQTTTTSENVSFEVLAVEGNSLVVRNQKGTQEYTVPDSYRFMINGQPRSVHELKAGMKGTAVVTTTVTVKPVYVTEVRDAVVVSSRNNSVTVKGADGVKKFSQDELDSRNVSITVNDKPMRVEDLEAGDKLTARIVTRGPPVVLTDKQVEALLAEPAAPAPAATVAAQPAPAPAAAPEAAAAPAAEAPAEAAPEVAAEAAPAAEAVAVSEPVVEEGRSLAWLYWLLAIIIIAILAKMLFGKKDKKS